MNLKIIVFTLSLILVQGCFLAEAQNNVSEQVEVKREYKPVLGESIKIRKNPVFGDESNKTLKQDYPIKENPIKADTGVNQIRPDVAKNLDSTKILPFYIRGAGGNLNTILAELYFNSLPNPLGSFGVNIRHLSQSSKLANERFSKDEINFIGKKILNENYISGTIGLGLKSNPYYGYNHNAYTYNSDQVKQQFRLFNLNAEFGKLIDTSQGIQYRAKFSGYYLGDSYLETENHYDLSGDLGFIQNKFAFNLSTLYQDNSFNTPPHNFSNSVLKLEPYFTAKTSQFKLKLGLKIGYEFGDRNQTYIFPDINLDLLLIEGFNVYGGLTGDIHQNTFKSLTDLNPYLKPIYDNTSLNQGFQLENTKESILIFAGIKGSFTPNFNYRAQIDIGQYDRLPFFINTYSVPDNFTLVYDGNKTVFTKIYGEFNYLLSDQIRINTQLTLNQYKLTSLAKPWYTPDYKLELSAHYNPTQDWLFTASLVAIGHQYYQGENTAFPFNSFNSTYPTITQEINPYLDMNFGLEYKASKKVGVFVSANNLLNNNYLLFYNYPVLGLNIIGGLSVRF